MRVLCSCHWATPSNFCARQPYLPDPIPPFQILCACLRSTHAPCLAMPAHAPVALAANWAGGKDDIVMTPARWRCEISEALAPGRLPVHSSPPTASAGLPLPQSHHLTEGATDDCVTSLPARHLPSLSGYGRHCRSTSNEASTPSPGALWCGCCECPLHVLMGSRCPSQARPGTPST